MTLRAVVLGLVIAVLVCVGAPYTIWMAGSSEITWSYFPVGVGVPFILVLLGNAVVRRVLGSGGLRPAELATILVMGLVVSGIPIFIVGLLLGIISSPYYKATPENAWAVHIQPYLPNWAIPAPDGEAMRWFYEGLPRGQSMPLDIWAGPLFWWLSLILTIYFVCFCLVVILRRQWMVHERLTFPLMEMPRLLIEGGGSVALRSRIFWIGCAIPLSILLFNVIGYFQPGFPQLAIHQIVTIQLHRDFPAMELVLYFPVVGFMFLASTTISFSIWFFYLVAVIQEGVTNMVGYDVSSPDAFVWGMQSLSWQAWGAFTAMVLWSLWMGRRHLGAVWRHVFSNTQELDDTDEMMSYRAAVYGMGAGLLYVLGWLCASGMAPHVALLFMFGVFIAYIGITRLVIQTGVFYLTTPVVGQAFATAITGTNIGATNLVSLSLAYSWHGDVQSIFMPSAAHAAKLNEMGGKPRSMSWAMGLAVLVGLCTSTYFVLYLCYRYGAGNFRSWYFSAGGGAGGMAFDGVIRQLSIRGPPTGTSCCTSALVCWSTRCWPSASTSSTGGPCTLWGSPLHPCG
jgi:hypothetical protein